MNYTKITDFIDTWPQGQMLKTFCDQQAFCSKWLHPIKLLKAMVDVSSNLIWYVGLLSHLNYMDNLDK